MERHASRHDGFTLVDLMLVLTILATLAVVPVLTFDNDENAVDNAARQVVADLVRIQGLAIELEVPLGVVFEPWNNRYFYCSDYGTTLEATRSDFEFVWGLDPVDIDYLVAQQTSAADGVYGATLTDASYSSGSRLVFDIDGTPLASAIVDLESGTFALRVRVQQGTGRITITQP